MSTLNPATASDRDGRPAPDFQRISPKRPNHSIEVEQSLLGGLILDNSAWPAVNKVIEEQDFYRADHRLIFQAISELAAKDSPFDPVTLGDHLESAGRLKRAGGFEYLGLLARDTPSAANVATYAKIVCERSLGRKLKTAADSGDIARLKELLAEHERLKHAPATDICERLGIRPLSEIMQTDYPEPRWAIPGILPEGLILLAGPPKVKKSWFALAAAIAIGLGGKVLGRIDVEEGKVLYLALEDRERRLQKRARAILADGSHGPDALDIATTWRRLDDGGLDDLRRYLIGHTDTRLVIVDTLALVRSRKQRGEAYYDADYHAISMLKSLADEFATSILVITHTRKQDAEDFLDAVIGTHGCTGAADGLLVLKRARCSNTAILSITGRDIEEEREIVIEWHAPTCSWHLTDSNAQEMKLTPERRRIVEILKAATTPLFSKQIATALYRREMVDKDDNAWKVTRNLLGRMVASGIIQQLEDKSYTLSASDPPDKELEGDKNTYAPYAPYALDATDAPYALDATDAPYVPEQSESGARGAYGACVDTYAPDIDITACEGKEISGGASGAYGAYVDLPKPSAIDEVHPDSSAPFDLVVAAPPPDQLSEPEPPPVHATDEPVPHAKYCSDCQRYYPRSLNCGALPGVAIEDPARPPCMGRFFRSGEGRP